jgi:WD40 repeat protein
MNIYRFAWVVVVFFIGLGFGQENSFVLRTALMGPKDQGTIDAVALSPDKRTLVFASSYGYSFSDIYILDARTGQTLWTTSECGGVYRMEFLNDEEILVFGGSLADGGGGFGCIININPDTPILTQWYEGGTDITEQEIRACGNEVFPFTEVCDKVLSYNDSLSPDQKLIADIDVEKNIVSILDAQTLEVLQSIQTSYNFWRSQFSPDNQLLALFDHDYTLVILDVKTGAKVSEYKSNQNDINRYGQLVFSPDNQLLLFSYGYPTESKKNKQETILWDIQNQQITLAFNNFNNYQFSKSGKFILGSSDEQIEVWDVENKQKLYSLETPHKSYVNLLTALDDTLLIAHYDENSGYMMMWDLRTGEKVWSLTGTTAVTMQDDVFITGNATGEVKFWTVRGRKEYEVFSSNYQYSPNIAFDKEGKFLATSVGPKATVTEINTGKQHERLFSDVDKIYPNSQETTHNIAFSELSNTLVASRGFNEYELYEITSLHFWEFEKDQLTILIPDSNSFKGFALDKSYIVSEFDNYGFNLTLIGQSSSYFAEGHEDGTAKLFDAKTGKLLYTFSGHAASKDYRVSFDFSPDERYLVTAGYTDGKILLWETATGELIKTLWADKGNIYDIEFSPGGNFLIVNYDYSTREIWDIAKEKIISAPVPEEKEYDYTEHVFSPNDALVATYRENGGWFPRSQSLWLWNTTTGEVLVQLPAGTPTFSPDGRLLAVNTAYPGLDNAVSIYGAEDNSPVFLSRDISFRDVLAKGENELVTNGSFTVGQAGWLLEGNVWANNTFSNFNSSPGYAALGVSKDGDRMDKATGKLSQVLTIPETAKSGVLSFWYSITTEETATTAKDDFWCSLEADTLLASVKFSNLDVTTGYKEVRLEPIDLSTLAGKRLYLSCTGENDESLPTILRLDDFSFQVSQ